MSEEKELRELQHQPRELTDKEREFVSFVRANKRELWLENRQLKAAIQAAVRILTSVTAVDINHPTKGAENDS